MNWQRVKGREGYWVASEGQVNYHLLKWDTGWAWEAYAPLWTAQSTQDGTYRNMKSHVEAFAAMVRRDDTDD